MEMTKYTCVCVCALCACAAVLLSGIILMTSRCEKGIHFFQGEVSFHGNCLFVLHEHAHARNHTVSLRYMYGCLD